MEKYNMNYSGIIYDDIANGTGIRTSLFVSGCRNNCPGCFNKEQQDFNYGKPFTEHVEFDIIESVNDGYHNGISILGGDPLEPENAKELFGFLSRYKYELGSSKTVWMYTGYTWEYIMSLDDKDPRKLILIFVDVLVDGRYIESLRDITLKFRGSSNQRLIDVQKSLKKSSEIVLLEL